MDIFHNFCKSLYKPTVRRAKLRGIFVFMFFGYTLFVYKSSIIPVENFKKYLWIQHKKMQPVVMTSEPSGREIYPNSKNVYIFSIDRIFVVIILFFLLSRLEI